MAYIDRKKLLEDWNDTSEFFVSFEDFLNNQPNADVIERAEYEKLQKENEELQEAVINCVSVDLHSCEAFDKLRSNINKAIDEIKHLTIYHKTTQGSELVSRKAVLRTINKYLGE